MFTYAHVKWFFGQSERAYYLNYFIKAFPFGGYPHRTFSRLHNLQKPHVAHHCYCLFFTLHALHHPQGVGGGGEGVLTLIQKAINFMLH